MAWKQRKTAGRVDGITFSKGDGVGATSGGAIGRAGLIIVIGVENGFAQCTATVFDLAVSSASDTFFSFTANLSCRSLTKPDTARGEKAILPVTHLPQIGKGVRRIFDHIVQDIGLAGPINLPLMGFNRQGDGVR